MGFQKTWSEEEESWVKSGNYTISELAEMTGRSEGAVRAKYYNMCSPKRKNRRGRQSPRVQTIEIDGVKLSTIIRQRGLSYREVGEILGITGSGVSNYVRLNYMPRYVFVALSHEWGITLEDLQRGDINNSNKLAANIDYDKLYQTIYSAVYSAMSKVWNN